MANKLTEFAYKNRVFSIFYMLWFLLHLIMLFSDFAYKTRPASLYSYGSNPTNYFWPFTKSYYDNWYNYYWNTMFYDYTEFITYLLVPVILFFIWKLATSTPKKTSWMVTYVNCESDSFASRTSGYRC